MDPISATLIAPVILGRERTLKTISRQRISLLKIRSRVNRDHLIRRITNQEPIH